MIGRILSCKYGVYEIACQENCLTSKARGVFRHMKLRPCVGDMVELDEEQRIQKIFPRKNQLIRPSISNLDLLVIVVSLKQPEYSSLLTDKFLSYANYFHVPSMVILTKTDLESKEEVEKITEELTKKGVQVCSFSKQNQEGIEEIKSCFQGKTIALMGQTGVGKSTLLNALVPEWNREIGEYSEALGRGKHRTKEVVLFPYMGGYLADTPGFSSLELPFYKEDLANFFPGFSSYPPCRYADCLHHENTPGCEVASAVKQGKISQESYQNYQKILLELLYRKDRY